MSKKRVLKEAKIVKLPKLAEGQSLANAIASQQRNTAVLNVLNDVMEQALAGEVQEVVCIFKTCDGVLMSSMCGAEFLSHSGAVLIANSAKID